VWFGTIQPSAPAIAKLEPTLDARFPVIGLIENDFPARLFHFPVLRHLYSPDYTIIKKLKEHRRECACQQVEPKRET